MVNKLLHRIIDSQNVDVRVNLVYWCPRCNIWCIVTHCFVSELFHFV